MWSKRDWIIFLTGAVFFHTLSHLIIQLSGTLPLRFFFINLTPQFNLIITIVSALVTLGLFLWSNKFK